MNPVHIMKSINNYKNRENYENNRAKVPDNLNTNDANKFDLRIFNKSLYASISP